MLEDIGPRGVKHFHGSLDPGKLGLFEKLVVRGVKAPLGDYRDFHANDTWTGEIADELSAVDTETPRTVGV